MNTRLFPPFPHFPGPPNQMMSRPRARHGVPLFLSVMLAAGMGAREEPMARAPWRPGLMIPAAIGEVPSKGAYCSAHHLVSILVEIDNCTEQQEVPEAQQQHIEQEDKAQRRTSRQPMGQVLGEHCRFLSHEQAAEGEQEGVGGDCVAPPLVAGGQAAAAVGQLVEQQALGQRLEAGAGQVLNEQEGAAGSPPHCCPDYQPAQVPGSHCHTPCSQEHHQQHEAPQEGACPAPCRIHKLSVAEKRGGY